MALVLLCIAVITSLLLAAWWRFLNGRRLRNYRVKVPQPQVARRGRPKPPWVRREVLRLQATTGAGCRGVANLFNRLYVGRRGMTVSKSYVAYTVRAHRYEIAALRRVLKHRTPRQIPPNRLWALDLTGKRAADGIHPILGIADHGSRKLLRLKALARKNAWTLLGHLFLAAVRFGKPHAIRTDNESMFRSWVFRGVLALAGIRHQFTTPGCPWQNGRIERLFGTLKRKLDLLEVDSRSALAGLLSQFAFWYNAVRPHQHLGGLTPDEAWSSLDPYAAAPREAQWFEAWDGLLTGYHLRF